MTFQMVQTPEFYSVDLINAARKLLADIMLVKPGEEVLTTIDTSADVSVAMAISQAAQALEAKPVLLLYETQARPQMEPPEVVAAAVARADVWIDLAIQYILYTQARLMATANGCRHACLSGLNAEAFVRTLGNVDYPRMLAFGDELVGLLNRASEIRITSDKGTDLVGRLNEDAFQAGGIAADKGALVMLGGQVGHLPLEETIHGKIVVDGEIWPPSEIGVLKGSVELTIDKGTIRDITGSNEAVVYRRWLESFNDPNLYYLAHFAYGFNPAVSRLSGSIVEDERIFGAVTFGFGTSTRRTAATHSDCIVLLPTILLDGIEIERDGRYTNPKLVEHCRAMHIPNY
jgi:leucyl aminopeptidase (aminopeptidase T)